MSEKDEFYKTANVLLRIVLTGLYIYAFIFVAIFAFHIWGALQ